MKPIVLVVITFSLFSFQEAKAQLRKPMWVWNTGAVIGNVSETNILINECLETGITDLYLYTSGTMVTNTSSKANMKTFIKKASCNNIRVWGMDGWRGYFSDQCGPSGFYQNIQRVINYNEESQDDEKFIGFHGDNEFHAFEDACGASNVFHWNKSDNALSTTTGGLWKGSEKADRDSLVADFVKQTDIATAMCHGAGIEYGLAIMSWVTGYPHQGVGNQTTPLYAVYKGVNKPLYHHLMDYVDEYVVMSYHTNVISKVIPMCTNEVTYGDLLPAATRPRIISGVETYCGVDQYVSYCDTPGEDNKAHVKSEMDQHIEGLGTYDSYSGVAIHDWEGWKGLRATATNSAISNNTTEPDNDGCAALSINKKKNETLDISVFPNPSESNLTISVKEVSGEASVRIFNLQGHEVTKSCDVEIISNISLLVQIENLSQGVYLVHIMDEDKISTVKVTKK